MLVTILVIALVAAVGIGVLAFRHRSQRGIESGISSFRRELHALAPREGSSEPPAPAPAPDDNGDSDSDDDDESRDD